MARERSKHASIRPSQAEEGGGKFTIPAGAVCTITEIMWTEWREAGESAIKKGRAPEDPALKITCDVDGMEEPMTEFLGAGKAARLVPSRDGEFLDIPDGSSATATTKDCNADVFLQSITDVKLHKKMAVDEKALDDGISVLTGLKFVSGRKIVERNIEDEPGAAKGKPRPTLIAAEILKLPKGLGGGGSDRGRDRDEEPARGRGREAEEERPARGRGREEEPEPERGRGRGGKDEPDDDAIEREADKAVLEVLDMPKFSKGLDRDKAFAQIYNVVKGTDNQKAVMELIEDKDWLEGRKRPWTIDRDGFLQKL